MCSSDELADATGCGDAFLGLLGEDLGAHNARHLGQLALAEDLEVALRSERDYYLIKRNLQPCYSRSQPPSQGLRPCVPPRTRESKACQGSPSGSIPGSSYSGNVSVPSCRSSRGDCATQTARVRMSVTKRADATSGEKTDWHLLFHHHDPLVVHATSVTATTGVLSCAADSAVSHGHVTPHTSSLSQPCYLNGRKNTVSVEPSWRLFCLPEVDLPFLFADRFNNNDFTK